MTKMFKVLLQWNDEEGGYTVTVPALPGCITEGKTLQEALDNAHEAITGFIEAMKIKGLTIPEKDARMFIGEIEVAV